MPFMPLSTMPNPDSAKWAVATGKKRGHMTAMLEAKKKEEALAAEEKRKAEAAARKKAEEEAAARKKAEEDTQPKIVLGFVSETNEVVSYLESLERRVDLNMPNVEKFVSAMSLSDTGIENKLKIFTETKDVLKESRNNMRLLNKLYSNSLAMIVVEQDGRCKKGFSLLPPIKFFLGEQPGDKALAQEKAYGYIINYPNQVFDGQVFGGLNPDDEDS